MVAAKALRPAFTSATAGAMLEELSTIQMMSTGRSVVSAFWATEAQIWFSSSSLASATWASKSTMKPPSSSGAPASGTEPPTPSPPAAPPPAGPVVVLLWLSGGVVPSMPF